MGPLSLWTWIESSQVRKYEKIKGLKSQLTWIRYRICVVSSNYLKFQMVDTPLLSKASNGHTLATPPPPPPRQLPQTLRCSSLSNNYVTTRSGMPNSYSMASSSIVSQQWKGQNHDHLRGQNTDKVVRQAQTQTETKMSCFRQFIFCLLANEVNYSTVWKSRNFSFIVKKN